MKTDLATTVITAIVGFVVAFLVCNFLLPEISTVSFKELDSKITYELAEPDADVFNFRAINPTVEVYVGNQEEEKDEKAASAKTNAKDKDSAQTSEDNTQTKERH